MNSTPYEGTCKGCGEWSLLWAGYCGECAPASTTGDYARWWNSPEGLEHRIITAEQLLSELALEATEADPDIRRPAPDNV